MAMNISGVSYNTPTFSTQNKQKAAQPTVEDYKQQKLAGPGMSFERFCEIFESDAPIEEKLAEVLDAFGSIIDKDALETSINAGKSGKMSMEELYRRCYARSWGRALTMEEADTMMKESQRVRRPHMFTGINAPENQQKAAPIINKVNSGQKLTAAEKEFLKKYYPDMYDKVIKAEEEAARVKKAMDNAKSPEEARRILLNAQLAAVSSGSNGSNQLLVQLLNKINSNDSGVSMFDYKA